MIELRPCLALCALLALAACATPRDACIRSATAELRTVDRLIAETEGNLRRGYAIDRETYTASGLDLCLGHRGKVAKGATVGLSTCKTIETRTREVPRAIDPASEKRKLAELRRTRLRLAQAAQAATLRCAAVHPR